MSDKPRLIDGIVLTKFDTIDDKVLMTSFSAHSPSKLSALSLLSWSHPGATLPPPQVGAAISMTYITGQPIVFVGTGQTYNDLRSLNARAVVSALMKAWVAACSAVNSSSQLSQQTICHTAVRFSSPANLRLSPSYPHTSTILHQMNSSHAQVFILPAPGKSKEQVCTLKDNTKNKARGASLCVIYQLLAQIERCFENNEVTSKWPFLLTSSQSNGPEL